MIGKIVIDAANAPLGRVASFAAKKALLGNSVFIVNCNESIISGRKRSIIDEYKIARTRGGSSLRGPNFPRIPERIMKRTVRGMLDYTQGRGREAFKRILCYNGVPAEHVNAKKINLQKEFKDKTLTLKNLSNEI